jgi:hypothetical protein
MENGCLRTSAREDLRSRSNGGSIEGVEELKGIRWLVGRESLGLGLGLGLELGLARRRLGRRRVEGRFSVRRTRIDDNGPKKRRQSEATRDPAAYDGRRCRRNLAPGVRHSGPWILVLAAPFGPLSAVQE